MIEIKNKNILKTLINKKKIILFSAEWCSACKIIKNYIKKIEKKINILFFIVDVEKHKEFSIKNNIKVLPTLIIDIKKKIILSGIINFKNIINEIIKR